VRAAVGVTVPTIESRTVVQFSSSKETDRGGELGGEAPNASPSARSMRYARRVRKPGYYGQ